MHSLFSFNCSSLAAEKPELFDEATEVVQQDENFFRAIDVMLEELPLPRSLDQCIKHLEFIVSIWWSRVELCEPESLERVLEMLKCLPVRNLVEQDEPLVRVIQKFFRESRKDRDMQIQKRTGVDCLTPCLDISLQLWKSELINARMLANKVMACLAHCNALNRALQTRDGAWWADTLEELLGARFDDRLFHAAQWLNHKDIGWTQEAMVALCRKAED